MEKFNFMFSEQNTQPKEEFYSVKRVKVSKEEFVEDLKIRIKLHTQTLERTRERHEHFVKRQEERFQHRVDELQTKIRDMKHEINRLTKN